MTNPESAAIPIKWYDTPIEQIVEKERNRALQTAREWRTEAGPLSPVIHRHLLAARAEQIRSDAGYYPHWFESVRSGSLCVHNCPRCGAERLATTLEAAAKGVK